MITKSFQEEYGKLNKAQKEAVDTIDGPVMVIAGPGTGKTTILTLRIANILLKTDTPPSGILALTFTEAGAKTMRKKLREIIGERAFDVPIHTFHGFAASVLSEFGDHLPHLYKSKQLTEVEAERLVREIIKDNKYKKLRPLGEPDYYVQKIISAVSESKKEAWTPEMLREHAKAEIERIKEDPNSISSRGASKGKMKGEAERKIEKCERTIIFANVYEEYEKRKKEERKVDFDDLLFELLLVMREDDILKRNLQEKYLYILVDEHQDTNDTQNLIVKTLSDFFDTPNLFVVGDEKQAIYRFQGASVENFLGFQKVWGSMKVISLTENYRSHQGILDASFGMIEKNYSDGELPELRVRLSAGSKIPDNPIEVVSTPDIETEESVLVKMLKELPADKNAAIIVRKNSEVTRIFRLLEEEGVEASAERGANIFDHPLGVLAFSLFSFLADPSDSESLAITCALGLWGLDLESGVKMIKAARSGNLSEVENSLPLIKSLREELRESGAIDYLILAAKESGLVELASKDPLSMEIWRSIVSLAEDLVRASDIESPATLIKDLLDYRKSAEKRSIKIKTGKIESRVTIMTAHSSKGLEFDSVFLPYATEESWIKKNRGSYFVLPKEKREDDDIRDDRRLFYVALTRARERVFISFHNEESGEMTNPLRFIDELDQTLIYRSEADKERRTLKTDIPNRKESRNKELIEYSKRVIEEKGLSVTALNHFVNCPSEFLYKSILKIPEAPNPSSEKGNAMHEAMANVWRSSIPNSHLNEKGEDSKGLKEVEEIISSTIRAYFKNSLLPKNEKEAAMQELLEDAPKVALSLLTHFNQAGSVTTEGWFERTFGNEIEGKKIEFKIHGKLDAVLEQDKKVLIYDYKTKEAMSEKAIKGETKSEDGNYFRQLVFYKMLLRGNQRFEGKDIEPALVFIRPNAKGECSTVSLEISEGDILKVEQEIKNLTQSVWSGSLLSDFCDEPDCKYCALKKLRA